MFACSLFEASVAVAALGCKANANSVPRPGMPPESGCNSLWPWSFGQILPERVGRSDVTGAAASTAFRGSSRQVVGPPRGVAPGGRNALRGDYGFRPKMNKMAKMDKMASAGRPARPCAGSTVRGNALTDRVLHRQAGGYGPDT